MPLYKALAKGFLSFLKFAGGSVILMIITVSLISGKFPPPLKDYYYSMRQMQAGEADFGSSMKIIADARKQQEALLNQIESENTGKSGSSDPRGSRGYGLSIVELDKKVKALEYEVSYYKAKFARSEWEKKQLEHQMANRTPAAVTISK